MSDWKSSGLTHIKDLLLKGHYKTKWDNKRRERYNLLNYSTEERAKGTRQINDWKRGESARAWTKKNKKAYYHPKPVPGVFEEFDAKTQQMTDMYEQNRKNRAKYIKERLKGKKK